MVKRKNVDKVSCVKFQFYVNLSIHPLYAAFVAIF